MAAIGLLLVLLLVYYIGSALSSPPPTCGVCAGETPVCDTTSGSCVGCTADAQCPDGTLCYPSGACTLCRGTAAGCPAGQYCLDGAQCVECRPGYNTDCDGNPDGPICSDGNACVKCRDNRDCRNSQLPGYDPAALYCDATANACVECLRSEDCSGLTRYCEGGICVACDPNSSTGCEGSYCVDGEGGPECVPCVAGDGSRPCQDGAYCVSGESGDTCVECVDGDSTRACPEGYSCQGGQCWLDCQSSTDCGATSSTPNCIGGVCVACEASSDCAAGDPLFPVCANGLCVQCAVDRAGIQAGCPDPEAPYCYNNSCQQCSPADQNADCVASPETPFCAKVSPAGASDSYQCVQCVSDTYCEGLDTGRPYCDPETHSCVACDSARPCSGQSCIGGLCQECGAGVDCPAGTGTHCAGGQCVQCSDPSECTNPAEPFCDQDGLCVACLDDAYCASQGSARPYCDPATSTCVACVDSANCLTDPARYCDPATSTCVACDADHPCSAPTPVCLSGAKCVECAGPSDCGGMPCLPGNVCGDCNRNCDCGDIDRYYCNQGKCTPLPSTCWAWKQYWVGLHQALPTDDAMKGPNYLAVIGRENQSTPWYYGETPLSTSGYGGLGWKYLRGNKKGDSGKDYNKTLYPTEGSYYYLAASPGCGRPSQQQGDAPIMFNGGSAITSGDTVCATLSGDYVFSSTNGGNCGPPTSAGTFVPLGQTPRGVNDCVA